jgi:SecD/SecF fusion protein
MQQKYTGRVIVILAVIAAALWAIFPSGNFRHPDLKPGIDMVGGTSLLYEIKTTPGTDTDGLSTRVMEALKKRVDPQGVRNLIWRPQGNTRLEIQIPMSSESRDASAKREAFANAQRKLEDTNIRQTEVVATVEDLSGNKRQEQLDELAMGSAKRKALFAELVQTFDHLQSLKKAQKDFVAQAKTEEAYGKLKEQIDQTNLSVSQLQTVLDGKDSNAKLEELKKQYANFPKRLAAIDQFVQAYASFQSVKNSIDDAAELKRLLHGSGVLEFHILADDLPSQQYQAMVQRLQKKGPRFERGDTVRWYEVDKPDQFHHRMEPYNGKMYSLSYVTPEKSLANGPGLPQWALTNAAPGMENGQRQVNFRFNTQGADLFGKLTGANINKPLAIVLDNKVISAPNINSRINGNGEISGDYTEADQDYLVSTLNAGSLPAQLADQPISEQTVGPQLGADNLRAGLMSCVLGLIVVGGFMLIYYGRAGAVAIVALLMNILMILGAMAAMNATFTLPAIAGIVLTIGIAVDANVLIFERLREEQNRGLSLKPALRNAYDRAFSAILDSNVTTAITCCVLYLLGTEEVKGFGLTLLLGIVSSLFTALFVTKAIFGIWVDYLGLKNLRSLPQVWPALERALHPKIDWMGKIWYFVGLSVILAVLGIGALVAQFRQGKMLDIEFASGTSVQFELKKQDAMPIQKVRKFVETANSAALPSPSIVSVGKPDADGNATSYEIITPNPERQDVQKAVLTIFGNKLDLEQPSTFIGSGKPASEAVDHEVFPLTAQTPFSLNGWRPSQTLSYRGGAAIVLKNISPKLTPAQIKSRIERQQLQPQASGEALPYLDFAVASEAGPDVPTDTAVVLVSNPDVTYDQGEYNWEQQVIAPMWGLINDALTKPPQLQKVVNFNPQIAGEMQENALFALILANLVIMAYIWLRFGNLTYGAATVAAMLHDLVLVCGFVGLSHYIAATPIGHWLMIEPFRINLTLVAGILTIMGYSMVDTIVVFDRIRENRGKYGLASRQVINDSINQTLSRTLLTAGTTLATVLVMYIFGGPGIHGFTYALWTGILIGTYSSIAIASPLLMLGKSHAHHTEHAETAHPVGAG